MLIKLDRDKNLTHWLYELNIVQSLSLHCWNTKRPYYRLINPTMGRLSYCKLLYPTTGMLSYCELLYPTTGDVGRKEL